ncbi:MAG TPA: UvrD-helicase domain-containing protein, partial [Alphaproteobacteria bacterium]|nr:UvrD-helicase domain-containing protein [Alphaproteobacteria bacterium]
MTKTLRAQTIPQEDMTPSLKQRMASEPTASVWVNASAGSGKTTVLTKRVLRLLLNGVSPQKIL